MRKVGNPCTAGYSLLLLVAACVTARAAAVGNSAICGSGNHNCDERFVAVGEIGVVPPETWTSATLQVVIDADEVGGVIFNPVQAGGFPPSPILPGFGADQIYSTFVTSANCYPTSQLQGCSIGISSFTVTASALNATWQPATPTPGPIDFEFYRVALEQASSSAAPLTLEATPDHVATVSGTAFFGGHAPVSFNYSIYRKIVGGSPATSSFKYQGRLLSSGVPGNGTYNMQFKLYSQSNGASGLVALDPLTGTRPISVAEGLFTADINFGTVAFPGERRWLEIIVNGTTLAPRQEITPTPYSLFAQDTARIGGIDAAEIVTTGGAQALDGSKVFQGGLETSSLRVYNAITAGQYLRSDALGNATWDSLDAADIGDEPGVASAIDTTPDTVSTSITTLLTRSITIPTAGYVLVWASGEANVTHSAGVSSTATFGVTDSTAAFPANQVGRLTLPAGAAAGTYRFQIAPHGLFSVASGVHTFSLIGQTATGTWTADSMQLSLLFVPTAYGTVTSTARGSSSDESEGGGPRFDAGPEKIDQQPLRVAADARDAELSELRSRVEALERLVSELMGEKR
ncbi:MAG: hypothetical protein U1D55_15965 [Phycisphaerae bacterium]